MSKFEKMQARLTEQDVLHIRKLLFEGMSQHQVAKVMRVSAAHINRIANGISWTHVPWPNGCDGFMSFLEATGRETSMRRPGEFVQGRLGPLKTPAPPIIKSESERAEMEKQIPEGFFIDATGRLKMTQATRDKINAMALNLERIQDQERYNKVLVSGEDPNRPAVEPTPGHGLEDNILDVMFMEWDVVLERAAKHPLVMAVREEEGETLVDDWHTKRAIGIVLFAVPETQWESGFVTELVKQARAKLLKAAAEKN